MDDKEVRVLIYSTNATVYDDLIIARSFVDDYNKHSQSFADQQEDDKIFMKKDGDDLTLKLSRRGINAYLISAWVHTLQRSSVYRQAAIRALLKFSRSKIPGDKNAVIYIKLRVPRHQSLDYKWNDRVAQMSLERRELDHAMSWLSTLGGGFSALGETFEHCAEMAGKISVGQLQLALRLGDPLLVARCKLWAALSLLQRGCLKVAKNIVRDTYGLAIREKDVRLQNMCKGIWAKLQYSYKLERELIRP